MEETEVPLTPAVIRNDTDQSVYVTHPCNQNVYESSFFLFDDDPDYIQSIWDYNQEEIRVYLPGEIWDDRVLTFGERGMLRPGKTEFIPYSNRSESSVSFDLPPYTQSILKETVKYKEFIVSFKATLISLDDEDYTLVLTGKWKGNRIIGSSLHHVTEIIQE